MLLGGGGSEHGWGGFPRGSMRGLIPLSCAPLPQAPSVRTQLLQQVVATHSQLSPPPHAPLPGCILAGWGVLVWLIASRGFSVVVFGSPPPHPALHPLPPLVSPPLAPLEFGVRVSISSPFSGKSQAFHQALNFHANTLQCIGVPWLSASPAGSPFPAKHFLQRTFLLLYSPPLPPLRPRPAVSHCCASARFPFCWCYVRLSGGELLLLCLGQSDGCGCGDTGPLCF